VTERTLRWRERVRPEWVDYNGHLSEAYYVLVFGHATDEVMRCVGLGEDYRAASRASLFTVEAHLRYLDQVPDDAELEIRSTVIGAGAKKLHLWHEMWVDARLRATEEILGVHVDVTSGRASFFPDQVRASIDALLVDPPGHAGRSIRR